MRVQNAVLLFGAFLCVYHEAEAMSQERVREVTTVVNGIDSNLGVLNKSGIILQTGTDRGGELTIYRKGSGVARIDATIAGSNSNLQEIFYYSNGHVIFIKTRRVTYPYSSESNGFDFGKPQLQATSDYYVDEGKLMPVDRSAVAPAAGARLLAEAALFISAAERRNELVNIEKLLRY